MWTSEYGQLFTYMIARVSAPHIHNFDDPINQYREVQSEKMTRPVSGCEWRVANVTARLYVDFVTDPRWNLTWCHPTMFASGQRG